MIFYSYEKVLSDLPFQIEKLLGLTSDCGIHSMLIVSAGYRSNVDLGSFAMWVTDWGSFCKLTHWGREKCDSKIQTTISFQFSSMKCATIRQQFHIGLFLGVFSMISQHWFKKWIGADFAPNHFLDQWWHRHWRQYATLGVNELSVVFAEMLQ